ncbi:MAG: iron-sulfur cluster carrier protein ApbC [Gammaproteobacteria bacterium]|jgi:ATP-binding protein involved in chromosome partitioning|nr:iron-sulfur cluster carrier protein ApbC [Gammaproteobacteria bacterium]MDP6617008.1 iron-sulfur cluster carrier protein ApbC [Gammaproteobacteria bacterium]MDP6695100.1 iron-sulfur cluster carrier protein ApbC [Gammaproteobacteria bacterium]
MPATLQNDLKELLNQVEIPWSGESLEAAGAIVEPNGDKGFRISIRLGYPAKASAQRLQDRIRVVLNARADASEITLEIDSEVHSHAVQGALAPLPGVSNILVVSSAKGGVGKSTVAANLALALAYEGARVGMLDADIYGPSQSIMLGVAGEQPVSRDGKSFDPLEAHGLQVISIGCLVDTEQPMVWRGPMVTQALNQLLFQTNWKELDYLVVDMPPGTGDIQLTLGQKVPVSGAIIVTTPQDIALADALRGLRMFEKLKIPVLGMVENMGSFVCPGCGEATPLFGDGGAAEVAAKNDLPLLGRLPLDVRIRQETDSGTPTVIVEPDSPLGLVFRNMALNAVAQLAKRPREYKGAFAGIRIEEA